MPFTKTVLHFFESEFSTGLSQAKQHQPIVQQLLDEHHRLGDLFPLVDTAVAFDILQAGVNRYKEKIIDALPATELGNGLRMKKEAMIDKIEFPDMSRINSICRDHIHIVREVGGRNLITIKDGRAIVDPVLVEKSKESNTLYATEAEEELLRLHIKAAEAISNLSNLLTKYDRGGITTYSKYADMFRINENGIQAKTEWYLGKGRIGM